MIRRRLCLPRSTGQLIWIQEPKATRDRNSSLENHEIVALLYRWTDLPDRNFRSYRSSGLHCFSALAGRVAQFPEITPPTIVVTAQYPGADPQALSEEVAQPIEQQVNGVENMLYMSSESAPDGTMQLTVTFKLGTDPNIAQVLVQNRVQIAEPQLPAEVRNIGITTQKQSPDILMAI